MVVVFASAGRCGAGPRFAGEGDPCLEGKVIHQAHTEALNFKREAGSQVEGNDFFC